MLLQFHIKSLWFKSFKFFNLEKLFNFPMNLYIHSNKKEKKGYVMDGYIIMSEEGHHGRDHMVVGFLTTYTISAYHH